MLEDTMKHTLEQFKQYWPLCDSQGYVKRVATKWHPSKTMYVGINEEINALRNAGAYVHIHGFSGESGEFGFEVTRWDYFNPEVFAVMGVENDWPVPIPDEIPF